MMRKVSRKIFLFSLITILALSTMPVSVFATSSQTSWEAPLPHECTLLNQTLTTYKHDDYAAEASLSANLYRLQKDYPGPGYEFAIATVATANCRRALGYTTETLSGIIPSHDWIPLTLGDDEGVWLNLIDFSSSPKYRHYFDYYGAYYYKVFITSNGFLTFDPGAYNDYGGKWTSPTPKSIPTADDVNTIIAPLWRDLDPSAGGSVKYVQGIYHIDGVWESWVLWENVPNKANGNPQTFAVGFFWNLLEKGGRIYFAYNQVTNDVPTSIGIEDQLGKRGTLISSVSAGQKIKFSQDKDNFLGINQIKVSASKFTDAGSNDDKAAIFVHGLNDTIPGGINVELSDSSEGKYSSFPIVSAASFAISTLAFVPGWGFLGYVGYMISAAELVYELSSMVDDPSRKQNANTGTQTAFALAVGKDEVKLAEKSGIWETWAPGPWDVSLFTLFRWWLTDASVNHTLTLTVEVTYCQRVAPYNSFTITTDSLELKLTPGSVSWYGRTNPDAHYYNFYQISTPYSTGYHIDTIGSNDYAYHMLGWSKLIPDAAEDYKVGADGKIRVKGYFRQSDTFSSSDQPGRRLVNIYVMYSENLNKIVKTAQVLDYTDGTDWRYKGVIISGLTPGKSVKIGIGRPDSWYADWNLVVEWAGIEIYEGAGSPPNTPSQPSGPTSGYTGTSYSYSTSTTDPDGDDVYYLFDWGDDSTTTIGPYTSDETVSASHTWGSTGTYTVKVKAEDVYGAWSGWSSSLTVTISTPSGGCPTLFVYDGTSYVDYGVINIHYSEDVVREVPVQMEDVGLNNHKATFRLREGWEGLKFSESFIDQVKLYAYGEDGKRHLCPLINATHSTLGNVMPQLLLSDDVKVQTLLLETTDLTFIVSCQNVQSYTFIIEGHNAVKLPD